MNADVTRSDFFRLSWQEYGQELETLTAKIKKYCRQNDIKIDLIVPILRGGATAGSYLAYQLKILNLLPLQYKYLKKDTQSDYQLYNYSQLKDEVFSADDYQTFLVVENNHCTGSSAKKAITEIKSQNADATIFYAAVHMDYSYQEMPAATQVFYSKLTNEMGEVDQEEAQEEGLIQKYCLFPWERLDEELAMFKEEHFSYQ